MLRRTLRVLETVDPENCNGKQAELGALTAQLRVIAVFGTERARKSIVETNAKIKTELPEILESLQKAGVV